MVLALLVHAALADSPASPWPPAGPTDNARGPDAMIAALDALAAEAPALVTRVDLGWSVEGRPLVGLRISGTDTPEAEWRLVGAHHGDEAVSGEVALAFAAALVDGASLDPELAAALERDAVWVWPYVNPDGVAAGTRYSATSVDLNRNYDYQWSPDETASGDAPFSEPESRALRALSLWTPFLSGMSLHAGATNLCWVWNYTSDPTPDEGIIADQAERYLRLVEQDGFYLTNGASWYITYGDSTDWSYGRQGTLDYTLELSTDRGADAEPLIDAHLAPLLDWLLWPDRLVGVATDALTGRGVPATLTLEETGTTFTSGPDGRFAHPVTHTAWTLTVAAPGYAPQTVSWTPEDGALDVPLTRTTLLDLRPEPPLLSRSGDGSFELPVAAETVALSRPGLDPVSAWAASDGWRVDLDQLAPGPWDLEVDGAVVPRALYVGELDDQVTLTDAGWADGQITASGVGFGAGTRAWAVVGAERALQPLPVLAEASDALTLDATGVPADEGAVDLVVLSAGRQLAAVDLAGAVAVDTGAPDEPSRGEVDTAAEPLEGDLSTTSRGCGTPAAPVWGAVALALALVGRRRAGLLLLAACQPVDLTQQADAIFRDCDPDEIRALAARQDLRLALEPCGADQLRGMRWSPDGRRLAFLANGAGALLDGEQQTLAAIPVGRLATAPAWLGEDLLALVPADPPARLLLYRPSASTLASTPLDTPQPADLQAWGDELLYTALDAAGARRAWLLDPRSGKSRPAFPYITDPLLTLSASLPADRVAWTTDAGAQVTTVDGRPLATLSGVRRAVPHPGGRWVALELDGAPISLYDQRTWDEVSPEARQRELARQDAWVADLPEHLPRTTVPPELQLLDLETRRRWRITAWYGDDAQWYPGQDRWLSFGLWGVEGKQLNRNAALGEALTRAELALAGHPPRGLLEVTDGP